MWLHRWAARESRGAFAVLLTVFAMTVAARADEPNDTLATATTTELFGLGTVSMPGEALGDGERGARDVDLYGFIVDETTSLPVSLTVAVNTSGDPWDGFLRLFDATGVELAVSDDRAFDDADPRIRTLLLDHGRYYVGVSAAGNPHYDPTKAGIGRVAVGGTYDLTITVLPTSAPVDPAEPNDSVAEATFVGAGSVELAGRFIGDGPYGRKDVDIYEVRLHGAARIEATVRAGSIGSPLEPVLRIRDCTEPAVNFTDVDPCLMGTADADADGAVDASLTVGVLQDQSIYLMVSGAGNRRFDPTEAGSGEPGSVGSYDLSVNVLYYDPTGVSEPNDSIGQATRLNAFATGRPTTQVVEATIGDGRYAPFGGDRDFFAVVLPDETQFLTASVSGEVVGSELDPVLTVYDFEGNPIARNDNWGGGTDASVVVPAACVPVTENLVSAYVEVSGARRRPATDPTVPFADAELNRPHSEKVDAYAVEEGTGSTGAYQMTLHVDSVVNRCGTEPDDTLATATATGLVDEGTFACTRGSLGDSECPEPERDVDMWSVEVLDAPATLGFMFTTCGDENLNGFAALVLDAGGAIVDYRKFGSYSDRASSEYVRLDEPGVYYLAFVAADSRLPSLWFDPTVDCSVPWGLVLTSYDLVIRLAPGLTEFPSGALGSVATGDEILYATHLDDASNRIDILDASSGAVVGAFPAPEPRYGGAEGLAFDGRDLHYLGTGQYPRLYRLDPTTGRVLDDYALWFGSGYFSDAAVMAGELFLLDYRYGSIHVMDPASRRFLRTMEVGHQNGVTLAGGLAALPNPERLYVADAFNSRDIHEVHPLTGVVTNTLPLEDMRPTALAATGDDRLVVGDWRSDSVEVLTREGGQVATVSVGDPVGSLAAYVPFDPFGDFDRDGDVDLRDYAAFGRCFTGGAAPLGLYCARADSNGDGRSDLADLSVFLNRTDGPSDLRP